jgi:dihydropteroate synthase
LAPPAQAHWSTQEQSRYGAEGVTAAVAAFLKERRQACIAAGIEAGRLWFDPGLGFGKSVSDNLRLLKELPQLAALGPPLLLGPSRKSFIGAVWKDLPVEERLEGTLAACVAAVLGGASILRVHDVQAVVRAVRVARAIQAS